MDRFGSHLHRLFGLFIMGSLLIGLVGCSGAKTSAEEVPRRDADTVTAEDIAASNVRSLDELLESRVPGVHVTETSGGIAVLIRGRHSIHGNNAPLYVVDGLPIEAGPDGGVHLSVNDIESIKVLKDGTATALYGMQGGNGVVVITLKGTTRPE